MVCPICNTDLYDGCEKCPNCNEYVEVAFQKRKLNEAAMRTGSILSEIFKSKRFLTFCIILSVVCGLYALAFFYEIPYSGVISAAINYGLYIGFGIVSLVAAWKLYSRCDSESKKELLQKFNAFPKLMHIMSVIAFVLCIIGVAGLLLGLLVVIGNADMISSDVVPELKNMILEMQASGEIVLDEGISMQYVFDIIDWAAKYIVVIMAVVIVIMVCAIVVSYFNMKMYKSITLFVQNLESTSITYAYISPAKFSAKLIKVMGIINIIAAAPTALGAGIGAIAPVMQGVLLIITSNLFREIDTRLEANAKDVFEQRRILENMMAYYRNKENSRESVEN